jgi:hypothetical protein
LTPRKPRRASWRRKRGPKGLSLGRADIYAEHFAAAIAVDRNRNYH